MMRKIAAAGVLAAAVGGFLLTAAPAMADTETDGSSTSWPGPEFWKEPGYVGILNIQTCRSVPVGVGVLGGAVPIDGPLLWGKHDESGPCFNGPVGIHH